METITNSSHHTRLADKDHETAQTTILESVISTADVLVNDSDTAQEITPGRTDNNERKSHVDS